jgi:hypothetical protein
VLAQTTPRWFLGGGVRRKRTATAARASRVPAAFANPVLRRTMTHADKERLGDEIAELAAHLDAATHRLLVLIGEFDASGGWADQGALSCAHWLGWRIGLELGAAREHVRVARALRELPQIDEALRRGQISYSKVRALTRVASAETEGTLLTMARSATASQLERICRGYRRATRDDARLEDEEDVRWMREGETGTGFVRFDIQLRAEEAALLRRALEVAASRAWGTDVPAGTRASSCRRADALVAILESYLSGAANDAPPVELVVHVDAGATLEDGTVVPEATGDRLACDAAVVTVTEDSRGNVLDVGRRRRTIPTLLRRALRLRDRGCRFPGCTNRRVDGHHVVPWSQGGATSLRNLVSLCRRHHTYVHEYGVRILRGEDSQLRFVTREGAELPPCDVRLASFVSDPVLALRTRNADIEVDATTSYPKWAGVPPDYDAIAWSLMPVEAPH